MEDLVSVHIFFTLRFKRGKEFETIKDSSITSGDFCIVDSIEDFSNKDFNIDYTKIEQCIEVSKFNLPFFDKAPLDKETKDSIIDCFRQNDYFKLDKVYSRFKNTKNFGVKRQKHIRRNSLKRKGSKRKGSKRKSKKH
jgi:hypothetical protein